MTKKEKIMWNKISDLGCLTEDFIIENEDKLNLKSLFYSQKITEPLKSYFKDKVPEEYFIYYQDNPEDVIDKFLEKITITPDDILMKLIREDKDKRNINDMYFIFELDPYLKVLDTIGYMNKFLRNDVQNKYKELYSKRSDYVEHMILYVRNILERSESPDKLYYFK
jgi:hypothetical protein